MKKLLYLFISIILLNTSCSSQQQQPNIIFILLDDLGKEWIEAYQGEVINTPTINRLAEEGTVFSNAYSMPQCTPSRVALLTGQYPWRNGWINHYDVPRWGHGANFDPEMYVTFAELLQSNGYKTCAAGKWQINDFRLQPEVMNQHGFDEYCMWTGAEGGNLEKSQERYWNPYIHTKDGSKTYEGEFGEDVFTDFIIDFMTENKDEPMMIYYPMCLPHGPLTTTPAEPEVSGKIPMHQAMVRYTDIILNRIIESLEELEIRDNTIIIWTTDNGTGGNITGSIYGKPVKGGKTLLSENGINAPFIVNCPGMVPEGNVATDLIDFTDLLPTFAELAGVELSEETEIDGNSFAPVILGDADSDAREWIMSMGSHPSMLKDGKVINGFAYRDRIIRNEKYKAYVDTNRNIYLLYELENDFYEENNLINSDSPEIIKALKQFQSVIDMQPVVDNNPMYNKLDQSFYNISESELYERCMKGKQRPNKLPAPKSKK